MCLYYLTVKYVDYEIHNMTAVDNSHIVQDQDFIEIKLILVGLFK
jgi:hypothetical protein